MSRFRQQWDCKRRRATAVLSGVLVALTLTLGLLPALVRADHGRTDGDAAHAGLDRLGQRALPEAGIGRTTGESTRRLVRASETAMPTSPPRAGLVVEYGDGRIETYCVDIGDPFGVSAEQLLLNATMRVHMHREYGYTAVCRIGDTGCPPEDCHCAFAGDAPQSRLWMRYRLRDGAWQPPSPSEINLSRRVVFRGDVEAWIWGHPGDGHYRGADRPSRVFTFTEICPAATATPTATPSVTPSVTQTPTHTPTSTLLPTDPPAPTEEPVRFDQPPTLAPEDLLPLPTPSLPTALPTTSPIPLPLPAAGRPSPVAQVPVIEPAAATRVIYLPLVLERAESIVISTATPSPPPTASPTPRLDLTATAAILQTEFALVPTTAPHSGAVGTTDETIPARRPASTLPPLWVTPSPRATPAVAGMIRPTAAPAQKTPVYPLSLTTSQRNTSLPAAFFSWLAFAAGAFLLALLALAWMRRRALDSPDHEIGASEPKEPDHA